MDCRQAELVSSFLHTQAQSFKDPNMSHFNPEARPDPALIEARMREERAAELDRLLRAMALWVHAQREALALRLRRIGFGLPHRVHHDAA
jgi:hypothetical protein